MQFVIGREIMAEQSAHRVIWFVPDRPVDGGTVFKRPDTDASGESADSLSESDSDG